MSCNILLAYLYFSKQFQIHTNASEFQVGAVIEQEVKLIHFYSRKLTYTQSEYRVTEKELIIFVKALK